MFTLPPLRGDPASALSAPYPIVLSKRLADKYFGGTNPSSKSVTLGNKYQFMVIGEMIEIPENSIFTYEGVIPFSFLREIGEKSGLTRERVRQIKEKAIRRLRHTSRSRLLKGYLG